MNRALLRLAVAVSMAALAFAATSESPLPEVVTLATLANLYPPVELDHALHAEITGDCASCHHQPFGEPAACTRCHEDEVAQSTFVHELHWEVEDCTGCHHRPATVDLRCVTCHPVEPDAEHLEVIGLKGAYHGLCLRCHSEPGDQSSCEVCHPDE